ncbi:hypothetical protein NZD85_09895 [Empedobacter stercoris]|uniref:hypothetical protein n=1 Tax=Empedobacter stercoris TaxID=1628248 RepID=UPI0021AF24C5|nr:hypothetical protein [Empedobacter stercoris]UWX66206.1 hypothetical protein NZD85_09895 [Empedobacter stercoris]
MENNLNKDELDKLYEHLVDYDNHLKTKKLHRLYMLSKIYPAEIELLGRAETVILLREIKETFINGQHLSTIILSQSFLEKALYNHLKNTDKKFKNTSFFSMITFARENNILSNEFLKMLDEIRLKRNPLVHQTPPPP